MTETERIVHYFILSNLKGWKMAPKKPQKSKI